MRRIRNAFRPFRTGLFLLCLSFSVSVFFPGCVRTDTAVFGTPAPSASPSPTPEPFNIVITAEPLPTDMLGQVIESDSHYYDYISYGDLRVYEYSTGTFLDGICFNSYPSALDGKVRIVYRDKDGRLCGEGTLHNASGTTVMQPGANTVYAEILTDITVLEMDFSLEVEQPFAPVVPVA